MAFEFEFTGRAHGDDEDRARGIRGAEIYCRDHGIDADALWQACNADDEDAWARWSDIEGVAVHAFCHGWQAMPENISLIWR